MAPAAEAIPAAIIGLAERLVTYLAAGDALTGAPAGTEAITAEV